MNANRDQNCDLETHFREYISNILPCERAIRYRIQDRRIFAIVERYILLLFQNILLFKHIMCLSISTFITFSLAEYINAVYFIMQCTSADVNIETFFINY